MARNLLQILKVVETARSETNLTIIFGPLSNRQLTSQQLVTFKIPARMPAIFGRRR
jgi:hypothetical protein